MKSYSLKINNTKNAAIKTGKWSNPGASFYNKLLNSNDSRWTHNGRNVFPEDEESENWNYWQDFLKEAYLIAPVKDIKNSPHGITPFSKSGCKYPHHEIRNGELVLSVPGVRAAYARAKQQGVYEGELKKHLERHMKELGDLVNFEEKIESNFDTIYEYILEKTGINLFDDIPENFMEIDIDEFIEKSHGSLKYSFRMGINVDNGHLVKIVFDLNKEDVAFVGSHDDTNPVSDEDQDKIINKINKIGYTDFVSKSKVLAIIDMDTNERLKSVTASGVMSGLQSFASKSLEEREKLAKDEISRIRGGIKYVVGQIEGADETGNMSRFQKRSSGTYKSTKPAGNIEDLHKFQNDPLKYGRGYYKNESIEDICSLDININNYYIEDTDESTKEDKKEEFVPIYGIIRSCSDSELRNDGTPKDPGEINSGKFAKLVNKFTKGDNYSHSLVSFDDSLTKMYSFNNATNGFEFDNIMDNDSWMGTKSIYLCVMFVKKEDKDKMEKFVKKLHENSKETRYPILNLLRIFVGKPIKSDKRFICSAFTGYVMSCANAKNLHIDYSRLRPDDITILPRAFYVMNVKDRQEFINRHNEIKSKVQSIYDEYYDEIKDYNNHLPKLMLQDKCEELRTLDKIYDWIVSKL